MTSYLQKCLLNRSLITAFNSRSITPRNAKFLSCKCGPSHQYLEFHFRHRIKGSSVELPVIIARLQTSLPAATFIRSYGSTSDKSEPAKQEGSSEEKEEKKLSLLQRFKQMYRDYWYVLLPVHVATSAVWVAGLYYLAKSGVDVVALLESMGASEKVVGLVKNSSTGYVAITYALYKIATPARYTVTLGGTTISINYLKKWGYIKPIPPKEKLKEMYQERRDNLIEKKDNFLKSIKKD